MVAESFTPMRLRTLRACTNIDSFSNEVVKFIFLLLSKEDDILCLLTKITEHIFCFTRSLIKKKTWPDCYYCGLLTK